MKKQYITPETQAVQVQTSCLLAASNPQNFDDSISDDYEVEGSDAIL